MGISQLIAAQKQKFRDRQHSSEKKSIMADTERLRLEKQRQAELAQANSERARLEKNVSDIKKFNEKHPTPPSGIQRFAQGLKGAMNKGKEAAAKAKKEGHFKGMDFGTTQTRTKGLQKAINRPSPFGGSGLNVGGSDGSHFSLGQQNSTEVKPTRPKKVVTRYY